MQGSAAKPLPPNATFYVVPAGRTPTKCRGQSCAAMIYFVQNPATGRMVPVDCDVPDGIRPSDTKDENQLDMLSGGMAAVHDGRGVSHFFTCCDVDMFTRKGAR